MLEVSGLHAFYGSSHVLFGIDIEVAEGEVVAVLGRNGMGKTTLIRSIMGLLPPREGSITMEGRQMRGRSADAIARAGVGLVPEGRHIFPNLTTEENLIAMAANRSRPPIHGPWRASTTCSRGSRSVAATSVAICPAASSRCWPLAAR